MSDFKFKGSVTGLPNAETIRKTKALVDKGNSCGGLNCDGTCPLSSRYFGDSGTRGCDMLKHERGYSGSPTPARAEALKLWYSEYAAGAFEAIKPKDEAPRPNGGEFSFAIDWNDERIERFAARVEMQIKSSNQGCGFLVCSDCPLSNRQIQRQGGAESDCSTFADHIGVARGTDSARGMALAEWYRQYERANAARTAGSAINTRGENPLPFRGSKLVGVR